MDVLKQFMNGEFAVHVGIDHYKEFIDICETLGFKWSGIEMSAAERDFVPNPETCIDFGVHNKGADARLFEDKVSYHLSNGYKVVEFEAFMEQYDPTPPVEIDMSDLMAVFDSM